jgi:dUTP pyrophosphatase
VLLKKLDKEAIPFKANRVGDCGHDVFALHSMVISPGESRVVKTGVALKIPEGLVGMFCSRSGLARDHDVFVLNAPGIVDNNYTGDISAILYNGGKHTYIVEKGDKVGQIVFVPCVVVHNFVEVDKLPETNRNEAGFGSSGK